MKKSNAFFAASPAAFVLLATLFTGCGTEMSGQDSVVASRSEEGKAGGASQKVVIGFSLGDLKEERWKKDRDLFVKKASDLGAKVLVQDAGGDPQTQIEQSKNLLLQGVNVLVVVPKNADAAAPILRAASSKKVPVISYDRLISGDASDAYVSFDNERVGRIQASRIAEKAPKGKYLLLGGDTADRNSAQIRLGQMKVLQPLIDKGDIRIVADPFCDKWSRSEATRYTEDALVKAPDLVAVVASNDGLAGGAIAALKAKGKKAGEVAVSGQDADLEAMQNVVAGWQTVTVYKPIDKIAEAAALLATGIGMGKAAEEIGSEIVRLNPEAKIGGLFQGGRRVFVIYLDPLPVTRDNVDDVIADGFHARQDIYGG